MPTARWVAVFGVCALGGAVALRSIDAPPPESDVARIGDDGLTLVVAVDAPSLDLQRCFLRLTPTRYEEESVEHRGELGEDGRFHVTGLADTDYHVELVARHDPSLVLGRAEFIRPGGEPCRLAADLVPIPSASGLSTNTD